MKYSSLCKQAFFVILGVLLFFEGFDTITGRKDFFLVRWIMKFYSSEGFIKDTEVPGAFH